MYSLLCQHKKNNLAEMIETLFAYTPQPLCAAVAADMEAVQKMALRLIGNGFAQTQRSPTS